MTWKKATGAPYVSVQVDEPIAFASIDGLRRGRDDGRTMLLISMPSVSPEHVDTPTIACRGVKLLASTSQSLDHGNNQGCDGKGNGEVAVGVFGHHACSVFLFAGFFFGATF